MNGPLHTSLEIMNAASASSEIMDRTPLANTINETLASQNTTGTQELATVTSQLMNATPSSHTMNGTLAIEIIKENHMSDLALGAVYYLKLFISLLGLFGNLCSIAIWLTKQFRKTARSTIVIVLALANTVFLGLVMEQAIDLRFDGFAFLATSDISCRIKGALFGISRQMDSWLILLLTTERLFAVMTPYVVKIIFDRSKTAIYVLVITLAIIVFNVVVITHDLSLVKFNADTMACQYAPALVLKQLIMAQTPLLFIIPLNIIIVVKVIAQYWRMRHTIAVTQQEIQKKKTLKITAATLSITLSHIALILPLTVIIVCCAEKYSKYLDAMTVMPMANAAINFYAYTISSREYRRKLMIALGKLRNHIFTCLGNCLEPCLQTHNAVAPEVELPNLGEGLFLPPVND